MEKGDSSKNENGRTRMTEEDEHVNENGADETDVFGTSKFWKGWTSKWMKKNILRYKDPKAPTAVMPVPKNALYYNMDHKYRGHAVLLNHEHFMPNMKLKSRAGTNVDSDNLEKTLRRLGFTVQCHYNLSVEKIDKLIDKVSQLDHSDNDCFVLACLSHGEQGILYAHDAPYKPDTLWGRFTADKCPSLAGKPKLFFIQACQGDKLDGGVTLHRTEVDSSPSYKIPSHADFLIAYSTIPGFYSWRNTMRGSWFMQALCDELNEHGYTLDLLTLLTFVNRKVAVDYESNVPDNSVMHGQKQIPCITYMLTRVLQFNEKQSNEVI